MAKKKRPTKCPDCGRPASGNFCPGCGVALKGGRCPKCGSALTAGSKSCNNCGHAPGAARETGSHRSSIIIAAALTALVVIGLVTIGPFGPKPPTGELTPGVQQGVPAGSTLGAGAMRAEADRFFDLAMRAHEGGDSAQAAYAGSMALGAYSRLTERDVDMRFHVGLLYQITHDYEALLAQADSIEQSYPNHLFAYVLRHRAHSRSGDSQAANDIYRGFLEVYEPEIASERQEYQAHARLIDAFRNRALQAVGN